MGLPGFQAVSGHAVQYLTSSASLKCSYGGCSRLGTTSKQGLRVCGAREDLGAPTPARRSSRSRSRVRELPQNEEEGDDRSEGEGEDRLRRRVRGREVSYNVSDAEAMLREVRDEKEEAPMVQHSLARMGMINSPDRRGEMTYLEEFVEQLADGKELQSNEEDIRKQTTPPSMPTCRRCRRATVSTSTS